MAYEEWLTFVFDRVTTGPEWYFDLEEQCLSCSEEETVTYLMRTFANCKTELSRFTDDQVGLGLNHIFNNSCSDVVFSLKNEKIDLAKRMETIRAIATLYRDCFTPRCAKALGHRSEPEASTKLNYICYMLWDISPIACWQGRAEENEAYSAVTEVLRDALMSPNIACVESALHGLGHIHCYVPQVVESVIETFLGASTVHDERLRQYADSASLGRVQ
jgi:hypothetical protein